MRELRRLWVSLLALTAAGCATVRTASDYDREVSFRGLATFDWLAAEEETRDDLEAVSPFLERRLRRSVEQELAERGFERRREGEVDFLVTAYVITSSRDDGEGGTTYGPVSRISFGLGFGFGYPWVWGYPFAYGYRSPHRFGYSHYPYFGRPWFGTPYFGYSYGFGYPSFGVAYSPAVSYRRLDGFYPGTLVVDILDGETGELIWRGWAEGALGHAPEPEDLAEFIGETIHKIMREFPPER